MITTDKSEISNVTQEKQERETMSTSDEPVIPAMDMRADHELISMNTLDKLKTSDVSEEMQEHERWMLKALEQAREALGRGEVPVGCLFVYEGRVIGRGENRVNETKNATRHAELVAIDQIIEWCKNSGEHGEVKGEGIEGHSMENTTLPEETIDNTARQRQTTSATPDPLLQPPLDPLTVLANSTLYVSLEPCIMCAAALAHVSVPRIVFGARNDRFGGCGSVLSVQGAKTQCIGGVFAEEAVELLKQFYRGENPNAPVPKVKKN
jgi:tRNA-specific adenosine deaminase 2